MQDLKKAGLNHSNTTYVNVKRFKPAFLRSATSHIQIQPMLMLNTSSSSLSPTASDSNTTYVNVKLFTGYMKKVQKWDSNTTYVNVKRNVLLDNLYTFMTFKYNLC